ncbi:MAG: hypothetical protein M0D55_10160 [Elusimicrobiota bacterium]|nr:MAG: hypothetical protein M0D55_10160 [Elusimicrobiota bacterium]
MRLAAAAAAALAAAWAFLPALGHSFVNLEDYWLILDNPRLRELSAENLRWMLTSLEYGTYQPLGWLSYALIFRVQGLNPSAYHLASWLAHAACAALLALWSERVLRAAFPKASARDAALAAGLSALTWALHPLRAEPVAWATGLPDLLSTAFFLAALLAWSGAPSRRVPLALALYVVSSLCRWKGAALPAVLLLLDWAILKRDMSKRGPWLELLPFAAAALLFSWLNARSKLLLAPGHEFVLDTRVLNGPVLLLGKILVPAGLTVDYWVEPSLGVALLSVLLAAAFASRGRAAAAAWAAYALCLAPSLLMAFQGRVVAHDRSAYLPAVFLHLALGGACLSLPRPASLLAAAALAAVSAAGLRAQLPVWRDSISLWTYVLGEKDPPVYARRSLDLALAEKAAREASEK